MQSKYELIDICILYTDPQLITDIITLLCTTGTQKSFLYYPLVGLRVWPWNFHQQRQGFHSKKVREFVTGSGKVREIWYFLEKDGKVKEENYYPCKFLTFKKPYACRNVCSWIVYDYQLYIKCYYLHLVLRWFNIANPFYFNLILTKKENFMQ